MTESHDAVNYDAHGRWWPWLIVLFLVAWWARDSLPRLVHGPSEARLVSPRGDLAADERSTVELFENAVPSVVYVGRADGLQSPILSQEMPGSGSGFVWDDAGHVVTNAHVVGEFSEVRVSLEDGSVWNGVIIGVALDKDIAVVRIDAPRERVRPITIGSSKDLRVGQKVFAIGNPFGLEFTLTTGVVSALDRAIDSMIPGRTIQGMIQTDAAINPGSSGGPLLDSAGRLIGINTAILSPSGGSSGIGFAVPVDTVNRVVPQIIAHGRVVRPGLGVGILYAEAIRKRLNLPGVPITEMGQGTAAHRAGLSAPQRRNGALQLDVIVRIDDKPTPTLDDLLNVVEKFNVGDTVKVTVHRQVLGSREFEELDFQVKLQAVN
jgi:S1-C subfamily serine protease